jgi:uncharacterized protein (DUF2235 family)
MKNAATKNIVLCFDQIRHPLDTQDRTNATALFAALEQSDEQVVWYHSGSVDRVRIGDPRDDAVGAVDGAYAFVRRNWTPGNRILVFGAGRGGYCAQALTRLLGTVGVIPEDFDDLLGFVVGTYAVPRTRRSSGEWDAIRATMTGLLEADAPVEVDYLGLWDATRSPALPAPPDEDVRVTAGRHAFAADAIRTLRRSVSVPSTDLEQAWFRGGHSDVAGGAHACTALAGISLDWVLDGAVTAGLILRDDFRDAPDHAQALAGSTRSLSRRTVPEGALVHASVRVFLEAHPEYWRRLPAQVTWTDQDWLARGERLVDAGVRAVDDGVRVADDLDVVGAIA